MSFDPKIVLHGNKVAAGQAIRAARILLDGQMRKDAAYGIPVSKVRYVLPTGQIVIATHEYSQTYLDISASSAYEREKPVSAYGSLKVVTGATYIVNVGAASTSLYATISAPNGGNALSTVGVLGYADNDLIFGGTIPTLYPSSPGVSPRYAASGLIFLSYKSPEGIPVQSPSCPYGLLCMETPPVYIGNGVILAVAAPPGSNTFPLSAPAAGDTFTNTAPLPVFVTYTFSASSPGTGKWALGAAVPQWTPDQLDTVSVQYISLPECPQIAYPSGAVSLQKAQVAFTISNMVLRNPTIKTNKYWSMGPQLFFPGWTWDATTFIKLNYNAAISPNNWGVFSYIGYGVVSGAPATEFSPVRGLVGYTSWSVPRNQYFVYNCTNSSGAVVSTPLPIGIYPPTYADIGPVASNPGLTWTPVAPGGTGSTGSDYNGYPALPYEIGNRYTGPIPPPPSYFSNVPYPWVLSDQWANPLCDLALNPNPQTTNNGPNFSFTTIGVLYTLSSSTFEGVAAQPVNVDPYAGAQNQTDLGCLNYILTPSGIAVADRGTDGNASLFCWQGAGYTSAALMMSTDKGTSWVNAGPTGKFAKYMNYGYGNHTGWGSPLTSRADPTSGVVYVGAGCLLAWAMADYYQNANGSEDPATAAEIVETGNYPQNVETFWSEDMGKNWVSAKTPLPTFVGGYPTYSEFSSQCVGVMMGLGAALLAIPGSATALLFEKGKAQSTIKDPSLLCASFCSYMRLGIQNSLPFWTGPTTGVLIQAPYGAGGLYQLQIKSGALQVKPYPNDPQQQYYLANTPLTVLGGHGTPYAYIQGVYAVP